ncbi:MAG: AMP-binding protein, partial [Patescibacteria group bacterium]
FEQEFKKTGDARFLRKKEDVVDAGVRDLLRILKRHRVSHFPAVPIIYERLVSSQVMRGANLPDLRYGISGAGALDGGTKEKFEFMSGATVVEGYGLSEASPIVSVNPTDLEKQKQGSLGQLVPGTEMKIVGNQLYIRGPQVMAGYWKNSKETQEAFEDGWLKTGDLVGVDERGFLHFKGRDKDMIKVMGDNIYPSEIESIIKKHQSVADAAVIGVADRQFGEKVVACVVLKDGASLTLEELTDYCRNSGLGSLKIPRELRFVLEIPKNIIGKVLKYELKKIIETSS